MMVVPLAVAWIVLAWARVELKVVVNTPLAFELPLAGEKVQLVPTEHDGTTVAPWIGFEKASSTVMVIVDAVEPGMHDVLQAVIDAVAAFTLEAIPLTDPGLAEAV